MKPYTKYWECRMSVIVCQDTRKSKAESALRRIGRTPLLQEQARVNKDSTKMSLMDPKLVWASCKKAWQSYESSHSLNCAVLRTSFFCAACRLSTAGKRGSSLLYRTRHWRVCVCAFGSSTCARKCVCVFACGYSWALMTTLGNSSWHQLHSIALLHQIASASMTKRSPLQIFQNHVVLTVPFISRGTSLELHLASQDGFRGVA